LAFDIFRCLVIVPWSFDKHRLNLYCFSIISTLRDDNFLPFSSLLFLLLFQPQPSLLFFFFLVHRRCMILGQFWPKIIHPNCFSFSLL
jgi:hypothetical protein